MSKFFFKPRCKTRMLNIGGGNWYKRYWENIDYYANPAYVDHKINLLKDQTLPFNVESIDKIFCSHVMEHLPDEAVLNLMKECNRSLKKLGLFRIVVPDMDKAFDAYWQNDFLFFDCGEIYLVGDSIERRIVNFFASFRADGYVGGPIIDDHIVKEKISQLEKSDFVDWCRSFIPKNAEYTAHINGFNYKKLEFMLRTAGFSKISKSSFRNSNDKELREKKFDNRPNCSLFLEASK